MNPRPGPDEDLIDWLQLARCDGVGPITFGTLLGRYRGVAAALRAARQNLLPDGSRRRVPERAALLAEIEALAALDGRMLVQSAAEYPPLVRALPDAPPVISVRGRAELLRRSAVAIVGARNASANGCAFARMLARELARAGLVVVSGLARGIDTAAHEGALAASGPTVAVIAAGADVAYPPENAALMRRIASEGAVVSERPLGATARAKDFPRRNRVIAGLSLGVVVVEAAPASGSLITARLALEYGREVMAVPGSPMDPRHRGTNQLLRDGAHLVESPDDILAVLAPLLQRSEPPAPRSRPVRRAPRSARPIAASEPPLRSETLVDRVIRAHPSRWPLTN